MLCTVDACHRTGDLKLQLHRIVTFFFFLCMHSISHTAMCFANVCVCYGTMQRSSSQSCVKIQKNAVTKCCAVISPALNCVHTIVRPWTRQVCKWFWLFCTCVGAAYLYEIFYENEIFTSCILHRGLLTVYHLYSTLEHFHVLTLSLKLCASE